MSVTRVKKIREYLSLLLLLLSASLLVGALNLTGSTGDTASAARKVERIVGKRMARLDSYAAMAIGMDNSELMDVALPEDMVLYKYENDSLKSWNNQFSVNNDDIHRPYYLQRLSNPRAELSSPLSDVTGEVSLLSLGPKWYLVKKISDSNVEIIEGLELLNDNAPGSTNGVNRRLRVPERFTIKPLSFSGGTSVNIGDVPVFKVLCESVQKGLVASNVVFIWLALIFFVVGLILSLHNYKTLWHYALSLIATTAAVATMYFWGRTVQGTTIFSPSLYADGGLLYSLGAVALISIWIMAVVVDTYIMRGVLYRLVRAGRTKRRLVLCSLLILFFILGVVAFSVYVIRSITANSSICLELYYLNDLSVYTAVVYSIVISLLLTIPLLVQLLRPGIKAATGLRFDALSTWNILFLSILFSLSLVAVTSIYGFKKESSRQEVWANRLTVDRDIILEMQLRSTETAIAEDEIISALAGYPNTAAAILNRITENYLPRVSNNYEITVAILDDFTSTPALAELFRDRVENGEQVADNSSYVYSTASGAHASYTGIFSYFTSARGVVHMMLEIEPKANKESKGYAALLGYSAPGRVLLPPKYSYAKYRAGSLVTSRGSYSYPVVMNDSKSQLVYGDGLRYVKDEGYSHFINRVSHDEVIIISRPVNDVFNYVLVFVLLALVSYFALSALALTKTRRKHEFFARTYYKSRVTSVLFFSLLVTLVTLASVSVLFVYRRNDANLHAMMVDKVNSIQGLIENACRGARSITDLDSKEFKSSIDMTASITKADISVYTPDGKIFYSTTPEIFDRMLLGSRIDQESYNAIAYNSKSYFIHKEQIGDTRYYALHAPIFNENGKMLAITSSPYTDENYDFELDAIRHLVTILLLFIILLMIARVSILAIVDRIFQPLLEMSNKMNEANIDRLEYISYDSDDEITSLVASYNRMVTDLSESTRQLAQAERDKAWSAMARQVAHEIKNPLTPMKLQLQRLIRLKQKDAPGWQDKFDEVAAVVLDHIDILSDTANEFSTFAKLYSETPTVFDLDALIQEEISMFDNRDNIRFSYLGFEGAMISGPKPQLTRVFVNLISNAIQAVEGVQQESGEDAAPGDILIQLRNSEEDGYYDIVFEDSGPGVAEENQARLFTPNFTTKSSGTGLGLAICRSILERCKATITYSRSFNLKGACFTIRYPKNLDGQA